MTESGDDVIERAGEWSDSDAVVDDAVTVTEETVEVDVVAVHGTDAADTEVTDDDVLLLEEVDTELVLPVWEPTGEPRVDAALDLLTGLDPDDVHGHAAVFDDIHQQLRATLTDLDATS